MLTELEAIIIRVFISIVISLEEAFLSIIYLILILVIVLLLFVIFLPLVSVKLLIEQLIIILFLRRLIIIPVPFMIGILLDLCLLILGLLLLRVLFSMVTP
jgi:hypothetical protein